MYSARRLDAEEDLAGDHERPQIEAAFAARDPGAVDAHELLDASTNTSSGSGAIAMRSAEFRKRRGIGVGAEQVDAAIVALVGLEALENLLRVMQHGRGRIEREIRARFDARVVPALRLVVADDGHMVGEQRPKPGSHELGRAVQFDVGFGVGRISN